MQNLYIDESGSMTREFSDRHPYFIIAVVQEFDKEKVRRAFKRFVSEHLGRLRALDTDGKMFREEDGGFTELKGAYLDSDLKREFIEFFCQGEDFRVFYIKTDNRRMDGYLYKDTQRAFDYMLMCGLRTFLKEGLLPGDSYMIQVDERNVRAESRRSLEDYLNLTLDYEGLLTGEVTVKYFDSADNALIQIADVFSNILFSDCYTQEFKGDIARLCGRGYIGGVYDFAGGYLLELPRMIR